MKETIKGLYISMFRIRYFIAKIFIKEKSNGILFIQEFDNTLDFIDQRYSTQMYNKYYIKKNDSLGSKIKKLCKAKYIYSDNYNVLLGYIDKKKVSVQVWHAAIAIKKIGFDAHNTSKSKRALKRYQRVYDSYTYYICASEHMKEVFMKSFNQPAEKMIILGSTKLDCYLDKSFLKDTEDIRVQNNHYIEKLNILYAPTFRDDKKEDAKAIEFINKLTQDFEGQYNVFFKPHDKVDLGKEKVKAILLRQGIEQYIAIADIVITDYSSVAMEAMYVHSPVIYYTPDYDKYKEEVGLNFDLRELPGKIAYTYEEVREFINNKDFGGSEIPVKYIPQNLENGAHKITTSVIKKVTKE